MAFDYKKEYKEFYMPKNKPSIVTVPPMNYIAVRGQGDPNAEDGEYKQAIDLLYGIAFTIKMSKKSDHQIDGYFDYVVPPLEGFWWQDGVQGVDYTHKENFRWISVIRLPDISTGLLKKQRGKRKQIFPRLNGSHTTRACVCSVCTSAPTMTSPPLSSLCTNIWKRRDTLSTSRISGCTMRSISAMLTRLLPKS